MKKKLILFITTLFLLTGCMKYEELNSLSIISNITISIKEGKYNISMQEIIPSKKEDGISYTYKYRQSNAKNLEDAIKKITNHSPKTIYLKKVQNIIISSTNKEKITKEFIEYYKKNKNKINKHCSLVIAKNDLTKIVKVNSDYKYIDSILKKKKILLKDTNKKEKIKIPEIKISNKELIFTRYYTIQI